MELCQKLDHVIGQSLEGSVWADDFNLSKVRFLQDSEFDNIQRRIARDIMDLLLQNGLLTVDQLFFQKNYWSTTEFVSWTFT